MRGLAARIEHQAAMAAELAARLEADGFTIVHRTPLPIVCFADAELDDAGIDALARGVNASGEAWITPTSLLGRRVLRACICSAETDETDLDALAGALRRAREALR